MAHELVIDRLEATVVGDDGDGAYERRLRDFLDGPIERDLDRALSSADIAEGEWCIRRLEVTVDEMRRRPGQAVGEQLCLAIVDELRTTVARRPTDVAFFRDSRAVLFDLVDSICSGRVDRLWAWQMVGLVDRADDAVDRQATLANALHRSPEHVVSVVSELAQRDLAVLDYGLGVRGWKSVVDVVAARFGQSFDSTPFHVGEEFVPDHSSTPAVVNAVARVARRSTLIRSLASSRVRVRAEAAVALAVLALAEAEPEALTTARAVEVVRGLAANIAQATHEVKAGSAFTGGPTRPPSEAHIQSTEDAPAPSDNEWPADARLGIWSEWAGLLFLLNVCDAIDIAWLVRESAAFEGYPLRSILHELAGLFAPVPSSDVGRLAFAGMTSPDEVDEMVDDGVRIALEELARVVAEAAAPNSAGAASTSLASTQDLCHRSGLVLIERGWIDVRFDLADVDLDVRRRGLDIDPGWLPWNGHVVRFRYE